MLCNDAANLAAFARPLELMRVAHTERSQKHCCMISLPVDETKEKGFSTEKTKASRWQPTRSYRHVVAKESKEEKKVRELMSITDFAIESR